MATTWTLHVYVASFFLAGSVLAHRPGKAIHAHADESSKLIAGVLPPEIINASTYEEYIDRLKTALAEPSTDWKQYKDWWCGLTMSADSFQGLRRQIEGIVDQGLEGDIYETGTWRGGTSIFMLGVLRAYERLTGKEQPHRQFYGFDSFQGFKPEHSGDTSLDGLLTEDSRFAAPIEKVRETFSKFGVLDDRVHFVKGYFENTVPSFQPQKPIAFLRMDGDLYSSTKVVLDNLYPHVQNGGWVIIDDYDWKPREAHAETKLCQEAVDEYRRHHGINEPMGENKPKYGRYGWRVKAKLPVADQVPQAMLQGAIVRPRLRTQAVKRGPFSAEITSMA